MPEETPQALPDTQAGQPGPRTAELFSPPQEPTQEQPLTVEDYRKIAREEASRIAQSQVAKGENRINQRIQEQFKALNVNREVLGLSDDQVTQAQQKIVTEAYSAEAKGPEAQMPAPEVDKAIQYMNDRIDEVFQVVGTSVESGDPEFPKLQKVIDDSWNDPQGLTKITLAAREFATEKAARVASQKDAASARVMSGGDAMTSGEVTAASATDLWKNAYKK